MVACPAVARPLPEAGREAGHAVPRRRLPSTVVRTVVRRGRRAAMPPKAAGRATGKAAAKTPAKGKKRAPARAKAADNGAAGGSQSKNGGTNGVQPRRKYRPFSEEESKALVVGVKRYGLGNWTRIHDDPDLPFMVSEPPNPQRISQPLLPPSPRVSLRPFDSPSRVRSAHHAVDAADAHRSQGQVARALEKADARGAAKRHPLWRTGRRC